MIGKAHSVNPFLTVMFYKTSFKVWHNYCDKIKKKKRGLKRPVKSMATIVGNQFDGVEKEDLVYFDYYEDEFVLVTDEDEDIRISQNTEDNKEESKDEIK